MKPKLKARRAVRRQIRPLAIEKLQRGDIVRHIGRGGNSYIITGAYGDHATAVRTVNIADPSKWEIVG